MATSKPQSAKPKGLIKQAITPGVLRKMPIEQKCQVCVELGIVGIDFIEPNDWPTLKRHGLICTMAHAQANGLNHKENHEKQVASLRWALTKRRGRRRLSGRDLSFRQAGRLV